MQEIIYLRSTKGITMILGSILTVAVKSQAL